MSDIIRVYFDSEYFNPKSTLDCGQVFRYKKIENGYLVFSIDKCAKIFLENDKTVIECAKEDRQYFYEYFDLGRDYSKIFERASSYKIQVLIDSAKLGKGIRILNQDRLETVISFIISQNNNIPRIKNSIEKICASLGEKKSFNGIEYYAFPTVEKLANAPLEFYKSVGLGYRAEYVKGLAVMLNDENFLGKIATLPTLQLKNKLISLKGIGPKVADCILLFSYHRSDSFPVDTWIEKVYKENFKGEQKDRAKISAQLCKEFGEDSGYFQQYLFYYKRSLSKKDIKA